MQMMIRMGRRAGGLGLAAVLLGAIVGGTAPAEAGIGLGVVLDLPRVVKVNESDLEGTITLLNLNSDFDKASSNLVFQIALTLSCGSRVLSGDCPDEWHDHQVFAVESTAFGREGSACDGTVFNVTTRNAASGEVTFESPDGFIVVEPADGPAAGKPCVIDFAFRVTSRPTKDSALAKSVAVTHRGPIETSARVGAFALSTQGMRLGVGGNITTLEVD